MIISLFSMSLRRLRMMGSFFMISFCCTLGSVAIIAITVPLGGQSFLLKYLNSLAQ
jgi:hypothetical protein